MPSFKSELRKIYSNRNLRVLIVADVIFILGGTLWWTFQPLYILALGASKEELGLLLMFGSATTLIPQIPGGIISDRFGSKRIILCGAILRLIPPLIFAFTDNWVLFFPGILLNSLSLIDAPAWLALLARSIPSENRATAYSVYRTVIAMSGIFTMPLGGLILDTIGIIPGTRIILAYNEGFLFLYIFILWRYLKEERVKKSHVANKAGKTFRLKNILDIRRLPSQIWGLMLVQGLCSFAAGLSMSFMVVYSNEVINLSKTEWGIIGTLFTLLSTVISIPAGFLSDRIGRRTCILISQALWITSTFLFINSSGFSLSLFARGLEGVASGFGGLVVGFMGGPSWQALATDLAPPKDYGKIMGFIGTTTAMFSTPAPLLGGYLYEKMSPALPFQLNIAISGAAMIILFLYLKGEKVDNALITS